MRVRNWGQIPAVTYTFLFSMLHKYKLALPKFRTTLIGEYFSPRAKWLGCESGLYLVPRLRIRGAKSEGHHTPASRYSQVSTVTKVPYYWKWLKDWSRWWWWLFVYEISAHSLMKSDLMPDFSTVVSFWLYLLCTTCGFVNSFQSRRRTMTTPLSYWRTLVQ